MSISGLRNESRDLNPFTGSELGLSLEASFDFHVAVCCSESLHQTRYAIEIYAQVVCYLQSEIVTVDSSGSSALSSEIVTVDSSGSSELSVPVSAV